MFVMGGGLVGKYVPTSGRIIIFHQGQFGDTLVAFPVVEFLVSLTLSLGYFNINPFWHLKRIR
jgi:hypothetical protein